MESQQFEADSTPVEILNPSDPDVLGQPPSTYSTSSGQRTVSQISTSLKQSLSGAIAFVKDNGQLFTTIGLGLLALIVFRVLLTLLDTIDDIPLLTPLLKLIGLSYLIWFTNRYFLRTSTRQELVDTVRGYKEQFFGSQPLLPSVTFAQTSSQASSQASSQTPSQIPTAQTIPTQTPAHPQKVESLSVKKAVTIQQSPETLYRFWRNFENLPRFMTQIESVRNLTETRSHWVAKAPLNTQVEWDAEVINEEAPKTIVWRSLPGADVASVGSVAFTEANGSGTEVKVTMEYTPPAGAVGAAVAGLLGENPEQQLEADLSRFKRLMETGTLPAN
ncbi:MAG: hypothetical protein HC881_15435 [Leptolyngbyaceae cyanobacterium SL_7_1]|nr:hypothetical protein [Leptolyngbyaceae cyanobacterium SL_7_1]